MKKQINQTNYVRLLWRLNKLDFLPYLFGLVLLQPFFEDHSNNTRDTFGLNFLNELVKVVYLKDFLHFSNKN